MPPYQQEEGVNAYTASFFCIEIVDERTIYIYIYIENYIYIYIYIYISCTEGTIDVLSAKNRMAIFELLP